MSSRSLKRDLERLAHTRKRQLPGSSLKIPDGTAILVICNQQDSSLSKNELEVLIVFEF